jgi:PilZ domain
VERRRVPRQDVGWPGRYRIEGVSHGRWRACRVIDLSPLGARLELSGVVPREVIGRHVAIEIQTPEGSSVSVRVAGAVRNVGPGSDGRLRIGIEFVSLSVEEQCVLDALAMMPMIDGPTLERW